jgi:hypothetical protein
MSFSVVVFTRMQYGLQFFLKYCNVYSCFFSLLLYGIFYLPASVYYPAVVVVNPLCGFQCRFNCIPIIFCDPSVSGPFQGDGCAGASDYRIGYSVMVAAD